MQSFEVQGVKFGGGNLSFLLGPCVVESVEHAMMMASSIKEICGRVGVGFVYKSSFDKANRSSIESFRGQGMGFGLDVLKQVKSELGVPVMDALKTSIQTAEMMVRMGLTHSTRAYPRLPVS